MKSLAAYTLARLGLFLATFAILWGVGQLFFEQTAANLLAAAFVALIVSAVASVFLLRGLRAALARDVAARADRMSRRFEAARAREDPDD